MASPPLTSSANTTSKFRARYKNEGLDSQEMRRRREEEGVQLRKARRDDHLNSKRRITPGLSIKDDVAERGNSAALEVPCPTSVTPEMVANLKSKDPAKQLGAVISFRKLLSKEPNPPIGDVIECGIIDTLVNLLRRDDDRGLQFETAWAITNIASGTSDQTMTLIDAGVIPALVRLMDSGREEVVDQAIWALGNIAGDGPTFRDKVIDAGIIPPLIRILGSPAGLSVIKNGVWCLSNLNRNKSPPPKFERIEPTLAVLATLLNHNDVEVVTDSCWALSYISDGPNVRIQAVLEAGVTRRLNELLTHSNPIIVAAALRVIGNIVTGDDSQTQIVINCNVLPTLRKLLLSDKESIVKEACWAISNITAGNREQIQAVFKAKVIPYLIRVLRLGDFKSRREAVWALVNATSGGTREDIKYMVKEHLMVALCELLAVNDAKVIQVALTGVENILRAGQISNGQEGNTYLDQVEECQGLDRIEELQGHPNVDIYEKAKHIIETYFGSDSDQEVFVAPKVDQDKQEFVFRSEKKGREGGEDEMDSFDF